MYKVVIAAVHFSSMRQTCEAGASVVEVWINASIGSIKGVRMFHDEVKPFVVEKLKIWTTVS